MTEIPELQKLDRLAREEGRSYPKTRAAFLSLSKQKSKVFHGLIGPRGVGKTILLKQLLNATSDSFYISVDVLDENDNLFSLAEDLSKNFGVRNLLLDEVHFSSSIDRDLKKIFDFLDLKIIFTSSVSLLMQESAYDLSRRVLLHPIRQFSFREYLFFSDHSEEMNVLSIENLVSGNYSSGYLRWEDLFERYLQKAILPFSLESQEPLLQLKNILAKVIQKDLPRVASLRVEELDRIEKLLSFIGKSSVDGINPSSLSRNLGITKYKAEQYLALLEKAFILKCVPPTGSNVLQEPKVLLCPPYRLLYSSFEDSIGGLREDFATEMLEGAGLQYFYLKNSKGKKCPDYLVKNVNTELIVEIGGKGKGKQQFKGIHKDLPCVVFSQGGAHSQSSRSLALLGFLY